MPIPEPGRRRRARRGAAADRRRWGVLLGFAVLAGAGALMLVRNVRMIARYD